MKLILVTALLFTYSCANPMSSISRDIEAFQRKHANGFATISAPNHTMHFAVRGSADLPPLVFIHGSPGSWNAWAGFLMDEELASRFQIIAVDRPGFGKSNPGIAEPSLAKQAADIHAVLSVNHSDKPAIVVGHSMGGPVAARLAMDFPKSVSGLVLVAAASMALPR